MIESKTFVRVRYAETDQMGIVNNANYPTYYEIGRTELFRELGLSYKIIESAGITLPLADLFVKYHRPALYDDLLTIKTCIKEWPGSRIRFDYYIYNEAEQLVNEGYTTLAYLDAKSRRPMRIPPMVVELLQPYFQ